MALIHIDELTIAYAKLLGFPWQTDSVIKSNHPGFGSGMVAGGFRFTLKTTQKKIGVT